MKIMIYLGLIMFVLGILAHLVAYIANKIYHKKMLEKSIENDKN